jgi:hypothetical protein
VFLVIQDHGFKILNKRPINIKNNYNLQFYYFIKEMIYSFEVPLMLNKVDFTKLVQGNMIQPQTQQKLQTITQYRQVFMNCIGNFVKG